jgi:hypothetical protein
VTKISQLSSIGDSLAIGDQFLIRDIDDATTPNKSVTVSGIARALPPGTALAPALAFAADKNTGIYSPGADQVAVATNGTQRLTVDTAATTSTLPVVHPLGAVGTPSITFTGDLNTGFWSPAADTLAASTAGSERLRITSAGLVGIGTSVPLRTLTSAGTSGELCFLGTGAEGVKDALIGRISSQTRTSGSASTSSAASIEFRTNAGAGDWYQGASLAFLINNSDTTASAGTERMRLTQAGLGIGTTSPGHPLEIAAQTGIIAFDVDGINGNKIRYGGSGANANVLRFLEYTGTERARIDSSGRLLVGTSSASDAQVGIASGNGWVYRTYGFASGNSRTVTVSASFGYWVEITLTLTSNVDIAQAKTILGRRDINSHRSATANVIGSAITQSISSSDAGETRTWTITYNHASDGSNKHFMFEVKSLNTATVSVT